MNLELIKKYEKEFLHMLHGGKLMFKPNDKQLWFDSVTSSIDWTVDGLYVIDDIYCTYRIALAEGRHIQFFNTKERLYDSSKPLHTWQDIDTIKTHGLPSDYRIKPEEPRFKVGDYVRYIHTNSPKPLRIININCERYYFENAEIILRVNEIEKWEPKEGEICLFWKENSEYNRAIIGRLKQILSNGNYVMDYGSGCTVTYSKCMPFTGALPPHMKDNK